MGKDAQERIRLVGHGEFGIGDTLKAEPGIQFHEIPRFPPEWPEKPDWARKPAGQKRDMEVTNR